MMVDSKFYMQRAWSLLLTVASPHIPRSIEPALVFFHVISWCHGCDDTISTLQSGACTRISAAEANDSVSWEGRNYEPEPRSCLGQRMSFSLLVSA